jgi:hypothetical protein
VPGPLSPPPSASALILSPGISLPCRISACIYLIVILALNDFYLDKVTSVRSKFVWEHDQGPRKSLKQTSIANVLAFSWKDYETKWGTAKRARNNLYQEGCPQGCRVLFWLLMNHAGLTFSQPGGSPFLFTTYSDIITYF